MSDSEPVSTIRGIGPDNAKRLAKLGIETRLDLVLHLPFRYQNRKETTPLGSLRAGEEYLVVGQITEVTSDPRGRRSLFVGIRDDAGQLAMRLLHYSSSQERSFEKGRWVQLYGKVRMGGRGPEMIHPEYKVSRERVQPNPEYRPVYPLTQGISQARLRHWISKAFIDLQLLPAYSYNSLTLAQALQVVHHPDVHQNLMDVNVAKRRIAFDELLAFQLVQNKRIVVRRQQRTEPVPSREQLGRQLLNLLDFELTNAQKCVTIEILNDFATPTPMYRLLQGDVGSGKTVVAAFAAIRVAENGRQTAIMAPTELLAEQHFETLNEWLPPLGINIGLLTGRLTEKERRLRREAISSGDDLVVIGTHALFQKSVTFKNLGLVIIDEQHRFGVHQRMSLRDKGQYPHQLVMTATPIPRTLMMTLYADMDVSKLDELPPGRKAVRTSIHSKLQREALIAGAMREIRRGRQVYWVCVSIEFGDDADEFSISSAENALHELQRKLPDARVGMVHGKLRAEVKNDAMSQFRDGKIDLLVATTVIEVGINVPNASLMVIDNAERLGLAQLHQLRGRVGRGNQRSYCSLIYDPDLSDLARERLDRFRSTNDGFEIAELDLQLRGAGDVLGVRQSGEQNFRVAEIWRDRDLLADAAAVATKLAEADPDLAMDVVATWSPRERDYVTA